MTCPNCEKYREALERVHEIAGGTDPTNWRVAQIEVVVRAALSPPAKAEEPKHCKRCWGDGYATCMCEADE